MESKERFIKINDEQVAVSEEVYREYMRPVWAERKRRERVSRCRNSNGVRCIKDCKLCDRQRTGRPLSLDWFVEDGLEIADPIDIEDALAEAELRQALRRALASLPEDERRIIRIAFQGKTEREAAEDVGLAKSTFTRKRDKIVGKLKEILIIYA